LLTLCLASPTSTQKDRWLIVGSIFCKFWDFYPNVKNLQKVLPVFLLGLVCTSLSIYIGLICKGLNTYPSIPMYQYVAFITYASICRLSYTLTRDGVWVFVGIVAVSPHPHPPSFRGLTRPLMQLY
jgi:hypothetical protein